MCDGPLGGVSGSPITGGSSGKKRGLAAPSRGSSHRLKSPREMASIDARQRILLISSLLAEIPLRLARLHLRSAGPPEKVETPTGQTNAAPSGSPKGPGWDEGKRPLGAPRAKVERSTKDAFQDSPASKYVKGIFSPRDVARSAG